MSTKIAYSLEEAAEQTGYSIRTLQRHIKDGNLIARYANTKCVIQHDVLIGWLDGLPTESPNA
jgi:hypothetical protein